MPKVPLDGMTLNMLSDGYAGRVIEEGLADIIRDINERGHDGKARKLVIELTLVPEDKGRVSIDTQVKTKLPAYRPPQTVAKLDDRAGGLVFNSDCSENPDQLTVNDLDK